MMKTMQIWNDLKVQGAQWNWEIWDLYLENRLQIWVFGKLAANKFGWKQFESLRGHGIYYGDEAENLLSIKLLKRREAQ